MFIHLNYSFLASLLSRGFASVRNPAVDLHNLAGEVVERDGGAVILKKLRNFQT
jgi:hypothetical protein